MSAFYTPWSSLNESEVVELRGLLARLLERLQALPKAQQPGPLAYEDESLHNQAQARMIVTTGSEQSTVMIVEMKVESELFSGWLPHIAAIAASLLGHQKLDRNEIILQVRDNGRGFDPAGPFPGHFGVHSIEERVTKMGGTVTIESTPGQGTCIEVRVPRVTENEGFRLPAVSLHSGASADEGAPCLTVSVRLHLHCRHRLVFAPGE